MCADDDNQGSEEYKIFYPPERSPSMTLFEEYLDQKLPTYIFTSSQRDELKDSLVRRYKGNAKDDVDEFLKKNDIPDNVLDPSKIIADFKSMIEAQKKKSPVGKDDDDIANTMKFLQEMDPVQKEQLVNEFNDSNLGSPV